MRLPPDYLTLLSGVSEGLGLTKAAFVRRCIERFVATEVDPDIAKAMAAARDRSLAA
jgi:predicted DNA-binding protein